MTNLKPFKTRFKRDFADGLIQITKQLQSSSDQLDDDDKMHISILAELSEKLEIKLLKASQSDFQIKLSPAQAIALRILYLDYIRNSATYMGSKLLSISNEVHKVYS